MNSTPLETVKQNIYIVEKMRQDALRKYRFTFARQLLVLWLELIEIRVKIEGEERRRRNHLHFKD
jgi:hypothetical protein